MILLTPVTRSQVLKYAVEIVAENAGRRFAAGQTVEQAKAGAVAELAERWPNIAESVAKLIGVDLDIDATTIGCDYSDSSPCKRCEPCRRYFQ